MYKALGSSPTIISITPYELPQNNDISIWEGNLRCTASIHCMAGWLCGGFQKMECWKFLLKWMITGTPMT